jgi:hypothetical protein
MSAPAIEFQEDYLQSYKLKSWLLTTDHKRIASYMARSRPSWGWRPPDAVELMTPKATSCLPTRITASSPSTAWLIFFF